MPSNAATIRIGADESYLSQSISRGIQGGLGRASGDLRSFDAQLERANRRVIAFGTSATLVYGTVRAFRELLDATVDVEKSLTSLNAIFGLTNRQLDVFGKNLFDVARETSESFKDTASAAEEFSRQGLGAIETLKRTRDAMILVRLTGLDVTKSVEALTASVNIFGRAGLTTTDILNKLVAVDQGFAVSARDLAESFSRVGNVATDAGVDIDKFVGLITAAQQITARGGPVIANALKTIFTRLERSNTLDELESLGIVVRKVSGEMLDQYTVLENVAKAYRNLTKEQQTQVATLGGGVFQINQFKALLYDLGKANGIAAQSTRTSTEATNEAIVRNAALNQTLASSIQNLKTSATQAASIVGNLTLKGGLQNAVSAGRLITDSLTSLDPSGATKAGEDLGKYFAESILKGIGNVLSGPGLVILGRLLYGAVKRTFPEVINDFKSTIATTGTGNQNGTLELTNQLLGQATAEEKARYAAATAVAEQEEIILGILERQVVIMGGAGLAGRPIRPRGGANGYIPTAADGVMGAIGTERAAISMGVGGAPAGAQPVLLPSFNFGGGKVGPMVANSSEYLVPHAANGGMAIYNQDMIQKHGLPPGATAVAAGGYVPNAAEGNPFSSLPLQMGSDLGLKLPTAKITELENLFESLTKAATVAEGSNFGPQILDIAKSLDKVSEKGIIKSVSQQFNRLATAFPVNQYNAGGDGGAGLHAMQQASNQYASATYSATPYTTPGSATSAVISPSLAAQLAATDRQRYADQQDKIRQETRDAERAATTNRIAGRFQLAGFGASIASGFIPEGKGGTSSGQGLGALSGGLQGFGLGTTVGSIFGPLGTVVGGAVGGLGGAIKGFVDKINKSFAEIADELDKSSSKLKQEIDNVSQAFAFQDKITEARASGASPSKIVDLQSQYNSAFASINNPDIQALVVRGTTDPDARAQASELLSRQGRDIQNPAALNSIFNGPKRNEKEASAVLRGVFGGLSEDNLQQVIKVITRSQEVLNQPAQLEEDSLQFNQQFSGVNPQEELKGALGDNSRFFGNQPDQFVVNSSRNAILQLRQQRRLEDAEKARQATLPYSQRIVTPRERLDLAAEYRQAGAENTVTGGANLAILQAHQQVALSNPGLTDQQRLALTGLQGAATIKTQFDTSKFSTLLEGKEKLIQSLGDKGGAGLIDTVKGQSGLNSLELLLENLNPQRTGGIPSSATGTTPEFRKTLEELIVSLKTLDFTENSNLKVNAETNAIQARLLRYTESRVGAADFLNGSARNEAIKQFRANRATLDNRGSEFFSGSQIESAALGQATQAGQGDIGDRRTSFVGGFGARFAGLKQDINQFAQVGQQVATALENSLGGAFGDFITGAQRGKDAFRQFVSSVLSDSARAFASKGVQMLLGSLIGSILPAFGGVAGTSAGTPTVVSTGGIDTFSYGHANGGPIGFASGGSVPSVLTGGEFVFSPSQVRSLGPDTVKAINTGAARRFDAGGMAGLVRGGSGMRDDVFARLAGGSYVVKKPMVDRYGASNLAALAGASLTIAGTPVGDQSPVSSTNAAASGSIVATPVPISPASGGGNSNVTIGVTINNSGSGTTSSTRTQGGGTDRQFGEDLAKSVAQLVDRRISEQTRVGGMLRRQSLANT